MDTNELMQEIMSLDVEQRRQVFNALLNDPELKINPFDAINIRQNWEIAQELLEMLESEKAATSAETP